MPGGSIRSASKYGHLLRGNLPPASVTSQSYLTVRGRQAGRAEPAMPRSHYEDDDDLPRPRRRTRRRRQSSAVPWIVGGVVLGLSLLVIVVVIVVARPSRGGRENPKNTGDAIAAARNRLDDPADGVIPFSTTFPPADWTHQDLANFLRTKGVVVE